MGAPHFLNIEFFNSSKVFNESVQKALPFAESKLFYAPILSSKLLTRGEDVNRVYDLALNIQDIDFKFEAGDTIGILPCNNKHEVEEIIQKLRLEEVADKTYRLSILENTTKKNPKIPPHLPEQGTIRNLLLYYVDIRSPPKKIFLQSLVDYVENEEEKKKLTFLCSKDGSGKYIEFISKRPRLLDVLNEFKSCCPSISVLLEHLTSLQPRPYSVSSSPLIKNELHITFSVISFDDDDKKKGVCTGWLENLITEKDVITTQLNSLNLNNSSTVNMVPFYFRKPTVRFPKDPLASPVVMIGPGTGVAPFVGYLQTRLLQKTNETLDSKPTWLFFGCRYSERDFIFKKELEKFLERKILTEIFTCFSRENYKEHVQDLIVKNGKELTKMICDDGAIIFVCGDVKNMMKDVKSAIISCFVEFRDFDEESAGRYVKSLQENGKYVEDSWL